jgi:hypothetical protein
MASRRIVVIICNRLAGTGRLAGAQRRDQLIDLIRRATLSFRRRREPVAQPVEQLTFNQ